jgi:hypothetical protein
VARYSQTAPRAVQRRPNRPSQSCSTCKTTNDPSLSVRPRRDTGNPRSFSDIGGSEKLSMCAAGVLGTRPADALGVKQELEKDWRRTASRRHNAPKLRQVTILARESLTTLPRFVASLSRRAAKRPFPAVGLNVAEGWKAVIRSSRLNDPSAQIPDMQRWT